MMFEFATATRIIFGPGRLKEVGLLAKDLGRQALVVTGKNPGRAQRLIELMRDNGIGTHLFVVPGEPEIETISQGTLLAKQAKCDLVVSLGGGSAIDAGKAIAALLTNTGELSDYLEIIGRGKSLKQAAAPFIAIPTTAGTGSEVTRNAVIASPEHKIKVSLRSPLMLPRIALIDPELTYDLPRSITASTGLDALTQVIEPYVSSRANPLTDAICAEGIRRAARSLPVAFQDGAKACEARNDMAAASLFGGLALANAGLGAVHGFAAPIGGAFQAPHGAICAALLPHVMEVNFRALKAREPANPAIGRFEQVARWLTNQTHAKAEAGVEWVRRLVTDFKIPPLRVFGITHAHLADLAAKAAASSSMKANPIALTSSELQEILQRAL
jgi:alcohol dehydrogenase class IV